MEQVLRRQQQLVRFRRWPVLVIALALAIVAGAIGGAVLHLRQALREQIAKHDGEVLYAVSRSQQLSEEADGEPLSSLENPADQFDLVLNISRLKGVLGIRLFSPVGEFVNAFPAYITEQKLPGEDLARLKTLKPISHYLPKGRLGEVDLLAGADSASVPLLLVNVPLRARGQARLVGIAQFILPGEPIAHEYAELDRHLVIQAAIVFVTGGGILTLALALAFGRLQHANRLLAERTASLLRANRELVLAAKTSAIGAVTSHLIHGLKNPLSGLQSFVNNRLEGQAIAQEADWQEAIATTQRMQNIISEVVRILGEQQVEADYEISLPELVEIVCAKMLPVARAAGIHLTSTLSLDGILANCEANLIMLVLENLLRNAIQATPPGKAVRLRLLPAEDQVRFEVEDEGTGLAASMREQLFTPCHSTKEGGSGLGLAISKQLATHLGGTLELKFSSVTGCCFALSVPLKILSREQRNLTGSGRAVANSN